MSYLSEIAPHLPEKWRLYLHGSKPFDLVKNLKKQLKNPKAVALETLEFVGDVVLNDQVFNASKKIQDVVEELFPLFSLRSRYHTRIHFSNNAFIVDTARQLRYKQIEDAFFKRFPSKLTGEKYYLEKILQYEPTKKLFQEAEAVVKRYQFHNQSVLERIGSLFSRTSPIITFKILPEKDTIMVGASTAYCDSSTGEIYVYASGVPENIVLTLCIFELCNAKRAFEFAEVFERLKKGEIDEDQFAKEYERVEFGTVKDHHRIIAQGIADRQFDPIMGYLSNTANMSFDEYWEVIKVGSHAEAYRKDAIKSMDRINVSKRIDFLINTAAVSAIALGILGSFI